MSDTFRTQWLRVALLALAFSIPLGTKKFLFSFTTPFSNFYTSEYTAAFLFAVDALLILGVAGSFFMFPKLRDAMRDTRAPFLALSALLLLSALSLWFAPYLSFGVYAFTRLFGAVIVGVLMWIGIRNGAVTPREPMGALGTSAALQAVIALFQFGLQKSVGLWWLGETVALGPETPGIANVIANGVPFLRAYGTLPHANILAGFLVLGVLALSYLFLTSERMKARYMAATGLVLVVGGLVVTFSRSGWIVAACALALFALALYGRGITFWRTVSWVLIMACAAAMFLASLWFVVMPRADLNVDESPVRDRWVMNEMGLALIAERPEGVGIGNQLFVSYDEGAFHKFGLTARGQWQPIHNIYLLIAAETGVLGLVAFLACIGVAIFWGRRRFGEWSMEMRTVVVMLLSLLLFGLFDHFLWDLHAGRLMLWVVLGILLGLGSLRLPRMDDAIRAHRSTV